MKSVIMKIVYIEQIIYPHQTLGVHIKSGYIDWLVGVLRHFQQYFSYIVAVSFIGGGDQSTLRKPRPVASH